MYENTNTLGQYDDISITYVPVRRFVDRVRGVFTVVALSFVFRSLDQI